MSHMCGSTCRRKQSPPTRCQTCGGSDKKSGRRHATPQEIGAAVDMYFDGLSYRRTAENIGDYFHRPTTAMSVLNWVRNLTGKAQDITEGIKVQTGPEWVADELQVNVGGQKMWLFNVMDSQTRFVLAAYLSPERTTKAAQTAMAIARDRAANPPERIKTDGLRSYQQGVRRAFPTHPVKHVVSEGIRAVLNNNLSERLQGTFRDRDKTLRALKSRESGQDYLDGLVISYNFFRPHQGLKGRCPAEAAGGEIPFGSWRDVAESVAVNP